MNAFNKTVEMIEEADSLFLSDYKDGWVVGEPCNSKSGQRWSLGMISSIEEAIKCKYPLICYGKDEKLVKYLEKNRKKK